MWQRSIPQVSTDKAQEQDVGEGPVGRTVERGKATTAGSSRGPVKGVGTSSWRPWGVTVCVSNMGRSCDKT